MWEGCASLAIVITAVVVGNHLGPELLAVAAAVFMATKSTVLSFGLSLL